MEKRECGIEGIYNFIFKNKKKASAQRVRFCNLQQEGCKKEGRKKRNFKSSHRKRGSNVEQINKFYSFNGTLSYNSDK